MSGFFISDLLSLLSGRNWDKYAHPVLRLIFLIAVFAAILLARLHYGSGANEAEITLAPAVETSLRAVFVYRDPLNVIKEDLSNSNAYDPLLKKVAAAYVGSRGYDDFDERVRTVMKAKFGSSAANSDYSSLVADLWDVLKETAIARAK